MNPSTRHVFGPVPSRRLGRSLGVDLVPFKTCTYDCIYCQLGPTPQQTVTRHSFISVEGVLDEVKALLSEGVLADFITLSGSGEPTLNSDIGRIVEELKARFSIPVAVLTNGSLLWMPEVRRSLLAANLVIPSLDASNPDIFRRINRPHDDIDFSRMLDGLITFREEYRGQIWLEVFLVRGINDGDHEIEALAEAARRIRPDRIQLNTVDRPPAETGVHPVPREVLDAICDRFQPHAEIIASFKHRGEVVRTSTAKEIVTLCQRRPCTLSDIAEALGLHRNEVVKLTRELTQRGRLQIKRAERGVFYTAMGKGEAPEAEE